MVNSRNAVLDVGEDLNLLMNGIIVIKGEARLGLLAWSGHGRLSGGRLEVEDAGSGLHGIGVALARGHVGGGQH